MDPRHSIRPAREPDVTALAAIERAAARLLEGHAPESVLNEATTARCWRPARPS